MTDSDPDLCTRHPVVGRLASPDVPATARFYSQLFGWQAQDLGEQMGHYTMFTQDGKQVAAADAADEPAAADRLDDLHRDRQRRGHGQESDRRGRQGADRRRCEVMDQGTMACLRRSGRSSLRGLAAGGHEGRRAGQQASQPVVERAGHRATWPRPKRSTPRSSRGLPRTTPCRTAVEYIEWQVDGRSIGGGMQMGSQYPPQVPPHWLVYFAVANTDDTVKRAQELGGKVMTPAQDIPQGRFAVLADPTGRGVRGHSAGQQ